ncbi:hypothetical protein J4433_00955 [Candidatus Pacearchaeota archaeon]|nr:hypothetical protein [Candidatus Pacearchaeota archaeon]
MVYRKEDQTQKLADYIKKNLSRGKGYTVESLKWALISQGHSRTAVENAVELANKQLAAMAPKLPPVKEEKIEFVEEPVEEKKGFFKRLLGIFKR